MLQDEILDEALQEFVERNLIVDVLHVLKSGKEATVCCCLGHRSIGGGLVAAKVYRPISRRSFKNDGLYRNGKVILSGRARRALANKSEMGRQIQFGTWVAYEWEAMNHLFEIGADVPRPIARGESAILMEYFGDEQTAAPQLKSVKLAPGEAAEVFHRVIWNMKRMLANNRIHGDLSPFNILWWKGRPVMIDFPQSVDPRENPSSYALLSRDIENVWRYCRKFGDGIGDPWKLAARLWEAFLRAELV